MQKEKSTFKQAFTHLYFLMLSADKIADLNELELGNKIIVLENMDKKQVMNELDVLSSQPRQQVYEQGINFMKSISRQDQIKCLGYIKLMAKADGSIDEKEINLLTDISEKELTISMEEISDMEKKLEKAINKIVP